MEYQYKNTNMILLKPELGKSKATTYDLPPDSHFYGKALFRDQTGAKEASTQWKYPVKSRSKIPARDFKMANKKAVQSGAHTLKTLSEFRRNHVYPERVKNGSNKVEVRLPEYEFQYGVKNRPGTPIQYVVGNFYGLQSEIFHSQMREQRNQNMMSTQRSLKSSLQPIRSTTSSRSFKNHKMEYINQIKQEKKPLFKISRFSSVAPRTNTYSQSCRSQFTSMMSSQQMSDSRQAR